MADARLLPPMSLVLLAFAVLAADVGCRKEEGQAAAGPTPRLSRYNCNIAEKRDIVDVFAEVVNDAPRASAPSRLVVAIERDGKPDVTGSAEIRPLPPRAAHQVSIRVECKGRVSLRQVHVSVQRD